MGPWSYYTHVTKQYVKKLGQLIKACSAHYPSYRGNPVIISGGLPLIAFIVYPHAPEFIAPKRFVIPA